MWYPGVLEMRSYKPLTLEKGMLFTGNEYNPVWALLKVPNMPAEEFFEENGYPVEPYIFDPVNGEELVQPHQIGWMLDVDCNDDGEDEECLRDITTKDLCSIILEGGDIEIEIEEIGREIDVLFDEGRAVIKFSPDGDTSQVL